MRFHVTIPQYIDRIIKAKQTAYFKKQLKKRMRKIFRIHTNSIQIMKNWGYG
jgi:flagellar motor switch protein FliM